MRLSFPSQKCPTNAKTRKKLQENCRPISLMIIDTISEDSKLIQQCIKKFIPHDQVELMPHTRLSQRLKSINELFILTD